ncbi:MAG: hypothetical protein LQ352_003162 [Teloschistes flavicans]|nr:MAG: hypothetical protein LQ352_003162 [Teloschistes flavicans]
MSSSNATPPHDSDGQSEAKRRRLRKGTHSCWECKRRKMKCIFDPAVNICNGCRRRGSQCLSQEFPDVVSSFTSNTPVSSSPNFAADGIVGVPVPSAGRDGNFSNQIRPTAPITPASTPALAFLTSSQSRTVANSNVQSGPHTPAEHGKNEKLSRFLHESFPSREDMEKVCTASCHPSVPSVLSHEIMVTPYSTLDQRGLKTPESLLEIPEPGCHPVLIARHMLLFSSFLQHLHPDLHKKINGLSESPRVIMERLADLAISLVTTDDELLGSIESLECVMIESVYQANIGSLRRSWLANRRAMSIAQLMGIHRPNHQAQYKVLDLKTRCDPQLMWFRIVFLDRYLCLLLGTSQGSLDRSMSSDTMLAHDTPMGRLERMHCVIASRILERNESEPSSDDLVLTRTLDLELQRAARSLPSKWWLPPSLDNTSADSQALFWSTRRLFAQVLHYNLLNQLHLPYMLRPSSSERKYEYSLIACVNASREVLSRFITLRSFDGIIYSCRTVDFLALMAAMTLLLAHLDSHRSETENLLAHQYHSDRAMIEKVQENMKEVNRLNSYMLSAQSADLLGRLLAIEIEAAADGYSYNSARTVSVQEAGNGTAPLDEDNNDAAVSVHIPYFGVIKIAREGISKQVPKPRAPTAAANHTVRSPPALERSSAVRAEAHIRPSRLAASSGNPSVEPLKPVNAPCSHIEALATVPNAYAKTQEQLGGTFPPLTNGLNDLPLQQLQNDSSDPLLGYGEYPEIAAGGEDWAFQGVDMAFFESLMRSTENERNEGADWTTVAEAGIINS